MGRCKDCTWWLEHDGKTGWMQHYLGWGDCQRLHFTNPQFRAWYSDGISTAPDFGCVQFEPVEPEENANPPQ